jgi:antitoxin VapB
MRGALASFGKTFYAELNIVVDFDRHRANAGYSHGKLQNGIFRYYLTLLAVISLRLQSKEVQIEQIGDALWLMPQTGVNQDMGQWLTAFYANTEPLPDDFLNDRKDLPLQERDWS